VRITIFTQFFSPEIGATQTRLETFARGLAQRGHEVEVICEVPNHPQGVIHEGFKGRPVVRQWADGYRVIHVWVHTTPKKTTRNRLSFYGSYAAMATLVGAARPRPDVILASSPPLPVAAAAAVVAAGQRAPWVMDVRDLWPAAAVALGELSVERTRRMAEWLERRLYQSASAITVTTKPFADAIASEAGPGKRVVMIPNGTTGFWLNATDVQPDRVALALPAKRFIWTYAGNVGPAQGLDAAVEAAARLDERFTLLILGDGPVRERLVEQTRGLPEDSVIFRGQVRPERAREYLRASDALLVPLKADPILASFVPSKLFDCCAVGRPVVVAADGEPSRLASADRAALTVAPGDPGGLARALQRLASDPRLRTRLGVAGRELAKRNLREGHIDQLASIVEETAVRGRRAGRSR
jgi:colanic acid biosynthesis glycosyl transferase WcaI